MFVSGNTTTGIYISSTIANGTVIQGNFVGTDVTGTVDLGNLGTGIENERTLITLGGTAAGAGNVISGNDGYGRVLGTDRVIRWFKGISSA